MATPHVYGEAFKLMRYATRDRSEVEVIWNSRDGITPFVISSRSGKEMTHVDWHLDTYAPQHVPKPGDRIFVRLTEARAAELAKRNVEDGWAQYPVEGHTKESWAAKVAKEYVESWDGDCPDLVTVTEQLEAKS